MAFVHGFENDVFISYAHADNEVDALGDAWVHQFQQNLRIALKQRLGRGDEINIYFDARRLQGNHPLDEILDSVRRSAVFLAVGSPSYVNRQWTRDELAAFVAVSDDPSRLFALERLPLDPGERYPDPLHDYFRISFWQRDQNEADIPLTLTPRLNTTLYYVRLQTLAEQIRGQLAQMANRSAAASARKKLKGDSTDIVGSLIRGVIGGARRKVTDAGSGHRASEARIEAVMAHLQARHGERERPEMRPVPWHADGQARALFESIDVAQRLLAGEESRLPRPGQAQLQALQQLQARPTGPTPLGRYVLLRHTAHSLGDDRHTAAWHQELTRDDSLFAAHRLVLSLAGRLEPAVAVSMFETSRQSLGDPPDLLPYGIHVHRRAGNASAAQNYAARCQGASNEALRRACARAR